MSAKNRKRTPRVFKNRTKLDYETKMKIYEKYYKDRPSISSLANEWNVCRSTITRIIQDPVSYTEFKMSLPKMKVQVHQYSAICEMEKLLTLYIEDRIQRNLPFTAKHIQAKALDLYNNIKGLYPALRLDFQAHDEWLEQFRLRAGYTDLLLTGDNIFDMTTKIKRFPDELKALIEVGYYLPQQIFNVDRLLLFWKSMPDGTFISQEAEKIASDRVTLVLGCNAGGDCKLKPLMIYKKRNVKKHLPVHFRSNPSSWLTARMFQEWFLNDFIPETQEYCKQKGIPFKILLLLDSVQLYRQRLIGLHPSVKVVFLPRNTARFLQPMDQGIKSIFKAFYFSHTLNMVTQATQGDSDIMVQDFCESYNIRMGAYNIKKAWDTISRNFLSLAWKNVCPQFLPENTQRQDNALYEGIKRQILSTTNKLGFEMKMRDVEQLIQSPGIDLTHKDLIVLAKTIDEEEAIGQINLTNKDSGVGQHITESTEVNGEQNLLTAYSPKHSTSTEDVNSIDSDELVVDCIKVEEPELMEPSHMHVIAKDSVEEYVMELSDSELLYESPTNEVDSIQVVGSANHMEDSEVSSKDFADDEDQFCELLKKQNAYELPASVIVEEIELAFDHVTCAMEKFESIDPNNARFQAVRSAVNDMLSCYREMFEEKRGSPDSENA